MTLPNDIQDYLRRLRQCLRDLPADQRDDILAELTSHFQESSAKGRTNPLQDFDSPEDYAAQFLSETALRGALARGTSLALGQALLVGARDSLIVLLAVVPLALLHLIGALLIVCGALKPFFATHVGAFIDASGGLSVGVLKDTSGMREVLGLWAIPIFIVGGTLILWVSNRALRWLVRRRLGTTPRTRRHVLST